MRTRDERATEVNPATAWRAVLGRDASYDSRFVYAVSSTKIYCRPSCPSRRPRRDRVRFFATTTDARAAGYRACKRCTPDRARSPVAALVDRARAYLDAAADRRVTLAELAKACASSVAHLQRTFTRHVGLSPKRYHDAVRARLLRGGLRRASVTRAMYDAGYGSTSRLHHHGGALGMTPSTYRKHGAGMQIRFMTGSTPLGALLLAYTARGVCAVSLGDDDATLERSLRDEFSAAEIERADRGEPTAKRWWSAVEGAVVRGAAADVPLDIAGTDFQMRVWRELRRIPAGSKRSYSDVAAAIGRPTATRAVARACATNRVAVAIPCHRVVREDGGLGGYRWGIERKKALLAAEKA